MCFLMKNHKNFRLRLKIQEVVGMTADRSCNPINRVPFLLGMKMQDDGEADSIEVLMKDIDNKVIGGSTGTKCQTYL